jgi:hypothetical protein
VFSVRRGETPSVFWFVGGTDPDRYAEAKQAGRVREIPTNHNPALAPVVHPALKRESWQWWSPHTPGWRRNVCSQEFTSRLD